MPEKIIIPFLLITGVAAIAYGMLMENNPVFIAGVVLVIAGYRLIRRYLIRSKNKEQNDIPAPPDEK